MRALPSLSLLCAALLVACEGSPPRATRSNAPVGPVSLGPPSPSVLQPPLSPTQGLRFILLGGGAEPASNQVSIGQDLQLAQGSLAGPGLTLFASGEGAAVAVLRDPPEPGDDIFAVLARLFGPAGGDQLAYESASLHVDGPATADHALEVVRRALRAEGKPLLVYAAGHGERGETPADNILSLWGGWQLGVRDLAVVLDDPATRRPMRLLSTACFGGGFAEMIFPRADALQGPRDGALHCGLFAAPWDDEASGCDPNPDRRMQQSYGVHLLRSLQEAQKGEVPKRLDLDGDGALSLLEAHTRARIDARSFDIPTTTSERWLAQVAPATDNNPLPDGLLPEERAVVAQLGARLGLADKGAAQDKLAQLDSVLELSAQRMQAEQVAADDAYFALRIALLERWPFLDHPWRSDFAERVRQQSTAMLKLARDSQLAVAYRRQLQRLDAIGLRYDGVRVKRAQVVRLIRAHETLRQAAALYEVGGADWAMFHALRDCERWSPALRR